MLMGLTYIDQIIIFSDNISAIKSCVFSISCLESGLMITDSWMNYSFDLIGQKGLQKSSRFSLIYLDSLLTHRIVCSGFSHRKSNRIFFKTKDKKRAGWSRYLHLIHCRKQNLFICQQKQLLNDSVLQENMIYINFVSKTVFKNEY